MGFVLDLTGSMQKWLNLLTKKIQQIIDDCLQHMGHFARVRIAIVGYRDWMDDSQIWTFHCVFGVGLI
jgi:uncharacterized protein YegL